MKDNDIARLLKELHDSYLKGNEFDEGDLLFYRINYRLMDAFELTKEEAQDYHSAYHKENPRRISEGYCNNCNKVVTIVPILYGVSDREMENLKEVERQGRIIIGTERHIKEGMEMPMYGCKICKSPLYPYKQS